MTTLALTVLLAAGSAHAERTHTVVKGDCLWNLAKHYYDNHFRWKVIYAANQAIIKDPHWIYPKQVFVIPDLPDPAIGEVGARPVETAAAVPADLGPAEPPAPAPPPAPPQEMIAVEEERPSLSGSGGNYDLSAEMPPGMAGGFPSMSRFKLPKDWQEDGRVTGFVDAEGMAAQGDRIKAKLKGFSPGEELVIYRRDAREELDEDKHATYLLKVGRARVEGGEKSAARLLILSSADSVQAGDLLKREAR